MVSQKYDIVAEAVRLEVNEKEDKLYIVFEVTSPKYKQEIKANWTKDLEFFVIDKKLVKEI